MDVKTQTLNEVIINVSLPYYGKNEHKYYRVLDETRATIVSPRHFLGVEECAFPECLIQNTTPCSKKEFDEAAMNTLLLLMADIKDNSYNVI